MKNFLKFDFVTLASVIISCIVLLSPAAIYAQDSDDKDIHYLQRILTLKGMYTGPIDGISGPETNNAIRLYKKQIGWPVTNQISDQLIERLREEEKSILPNTNSELPNSLNEEKLAALAQELKETQENLKNTNEALRTITNNMSDHFINNFNNLFTLLLSILAIVVTAFSVWLGWYIPRFQEEITDKVRKAHDEMLRLTESRVSARVLTDFSAHCIYLYKDIDKSDTKYKNYLDMAISLSGLAFDKAENLTDDSSLTGEDKKVKSACLNNRIYYLLERGTDKDKWEAEKHFKDLQDVAEEHEKSLITGWWSVKETLAWAMLKLYPDKKNEIKKIIQSLLTNSSLDAKWVSDLHNKWEKIDRFYTE
ncbi:MAG: peptidoglycan-binding protein [Nitrosomonas sp.]|nr:MAG: peptidoglycan-binding protein [Nitrosomonas sp.]